ncbi:MAG: hypothetical protein ACPL7D_07455 [Candidatus Sumerlaeaceae bacterium]|jgi:Fe2+ transport system protein FeoA
MTDKRPSLATQSKEKDLAPVAFSQEGSANVAESDVSPGSLEMEVFRTGDYGPKGVWTEEDLKQLARDYSPDVLEAPLTFDHARRGPAFGWVETLRHEGDRLVARIAGIPEIVHKLVRMGAYKKRSVEILRCLPATGRPYIRAVSLLGAASPAVPGLREIVFTDHQGEVIAFDDDEEITALRVMVGKLRAEIGRLRHEQRRGDARELVTRVRARGIALTQREAELIESFCLAVEPSKALVRFSDDEFLPLAWLNEFLLARAPSVPEGEVASPAPTEISAPKTAGPPPPQADPVSVALHQRALALQESDARLTYAAALSAAARAMGTAHRRFSH